MSPRPILKRAQSTSADPHHHQHQHHIPRHLAHCHHPAVHFPPSPALTRTFSAYSASAYDRSPIVVTPNSCALPERGCPGRTYLLEERAAPRGIAFARDYHPRALAFASASNACGPAYAPVPPLVPDLSSESDESDGFYPLPAPPAAPYHTSSPAIARPAEDDAPAFVYPDDATAAHKHKHRPFAPVAEDDAAPQPRVRRRARRHESSRDPDRIPGGEAPGLASLSLSSAPPAPAPASPSPRKKGVRRPHAPCAPPPPLALSGCGFGMPDDGCLGGF